MRRSTARRARRTPRRHLAARAVRAVGLAALPCLAACGDRYASEGERLARTHCGACHAFPTPHLLDRETWEAHVLPRMAPRLGVDPLSIRPEPPRDPHMAVLPVSLPLHDWRSIVEYYRTESPDSLPPQALPSQPGLDPPAFTTGAFAPGVETSAVITLLEVDPAHARIFVGDAATNRLLVLDPAGALLMAGATGSPPTDVIPAADHVLVLESGILHPNDEPRGRLVRYELGSDGSLRPGPVLVDSLFRPVFVEPADLDGDGRVELIICEYGDDIGRLAVYRETGSGYQRQVLADTPGAIRFEITDLTGDGHADLVALFAQGDERIVLFEGDGRGSFRTPRPLARFPPVYGSMHFSMHDFDGDGHLDILYVNGDNFDFSRVPKPYHGIRILENDGRNRFEQRWFFPVYGAARAEAVDFDDDGDLDLLATSNFADPDRHPERGIMFFENVGPYAFQPHAFGLAAASQWNRIAISDLDGDGRPDALIGAMSLESIAADQRGWGAGRTAPSPNALLLFRNATTAPSR